MPVKRHPLITFYTLAFVLSWSGWIPQTLHARGVLPVDSPIFALLGGAGPTLAAVITLLALNQAHSIRNLFSPLFRFGAPLRWYVFTFGFWWIIAAVALGLATMLGQTSPALDQVSWISLPAVWVAMLLSNVWEEIGWRGFALPRLREKLSDLQAALVMGVVWSAWHLPLLLNPASPMSSLPWYGEIIFSVSLTVIYTWLWLNTGHSLFFVSVFHAMSNTIAFTLLEAGAFTSTYAFVVGGTTLVALIIAGFMGRRVVTPSQQL